MTGQFSKLAEGLYADIRIRAVGCGLMLGWLAWEMSTRGEPTAFRLAMTLVMLVSGSLSFTTHAIHANPKAKRNPRNGVQLWIALLGAGMVAAITGLNTTLV